MMKQQEYKIIIHSVPRIFISMMVILITLVLLIDEYTPRIENKIINILQFTAILISSFYLAQLIGKAKVKVMFTHEGFKHIWERRFLFSWEKNHTIPWDIVDNYVFQEDRNFDSFIINLTNNKRYKINRINFLPYRDDFKKLLKDFPKLSNQFKTGVQTSDRSKIKKGKTIYETKAFKWFFYILSAGFTLLLIGKLTDPNSLTPWSSLGVIGFGVMFYGAMISQTNKK